MGALTDFITDTEAESNPFVESPFTIEQQAQERIFELPQIGDEGFVQEDQGGEDPGMVRPGPMVNNAPNGQMPNLVPQKNMAQRWAEAAKQPLPNAGQIQQKNRELLKNRSDSTTRYYTRQLYRDILKQRGGDPESRMQARLGLRIQGASDDPSQYASNQQRPAGVQTGAQAGNPAWEEMFPNRPVVDRATKQVAMQQGQPVEDAGWRSIFPEAPKTQELPRLSVGPPTSKPSNAPQSDVVSTLVDDIIAGNLKNRI